MTTVIVGSGADAALQCAASALPAAVFVVRPADLSRPGWSIDLDGEEPGSYVASGAVHSTSELVAAFVTIPKIVPGELTWFDDADDRQYVSSEMNATLRTWLGSLPPDRVVGRPLAGGLAGSGRSRAAWRPQFEQHRAEFYEEIADADDWACVLHGEVLASHQTFAELARTVAISAGVDYLWIRGTAYPTSSSVREIRDYPSFADPAEMSAIVELASARTFS